MRWCTMHEQIVSSQSYSNLVYLAGIISLPVGSGILSAIAWGLVSRRARVILAVFVSIVSFGMFDLALFRSMPMLGLSFGPVHFPFLSITLIRGLATLSGALVVAAYLVVRYVFARRFRLSPLPSSWWGVPFLFNLAVSGCLIHGLIFEPLSIQTETVPIASGNLRAGTTPLRIVQISDTHFERLTRRERDAIDIVNALDADLILMTGDYLNISYLNDAESRQAFRHFVGQLRSRHGIYAVWGNTDLVPWRDELVAGLGITILEDEIVKLEINGQHISVLGLNIHHATEKDRAKLRQLAQSLPPDHFNILLYHAPDLMPEAVETGKVDLYLAGHTHGGQIRLPWYGAIVTASIYGKRYEAGQYQEGRTRLYVSRGLGFEGGHAPRVRFLCPPEITLFALSG